MMRECFVLFDTQGDITKVVLGDVETYAKANDYKVHWGRDNAGGQLEKGGRYRSFVCTTLENN